MNGEDVQVWFDGNSVDDGFVAVFGPLDMSLTPGQKVLANMENEALFEATVVSATAITNRRDIATIRLGAQVDIGRTNRSQPDG